MKKKVQMLLEIVPDNGWGSLNKRQKHHALATIGHRLKLPPYGSWPAHDGHWPELEVDADTAGGPIWAQLKATAETVVQNYSNHRKDLDSAKKPLAAETSNQQDQGYVIINGVVYCTHSWSINETAASSAPDPWPEDWVNPDGSRNDLATQIRVRVLFEV